MRRRVVLICALTDASTVPAASVSRPGYQDRGLLRNFGARNQNTRQNVLELCILIASAPRDWNITFLPMLTDARSEKL